MILYMVVPNDRERYPSHNAHGRATYTTLRNAQKEHKSQVDYINKWMERRPDLPRPVMPIIIKIDTMDGEVVE